jgi:hypothetical protein
MTARIYIMSHREKCRKRLGYANAATDKREHVKTEKGTNSKTKILDRNSLILRTGYERRTLM